MPEHRSQRAQRSRPGRLHGFWKRHEGELRFCGLFAAFFLLFLWLLMVRHGAEEGWMIEESFTQGVVWVSARMLELLGFSAWSGGRVLQVGSFRVQVINGCNGVEALVIYLAAVLAYPAPLRAKGIALAVGIPLIQVVNLGRILGLALVGAYFSPLFREAHLFVAQGVMVCMVAAVWQWWMKRYACQSTA